MSTTRSSIDGPFAATSARNPRVGRGLDYAASRGSAAECACGFSFGTPRGEAYNEAAFRYFLNVERKRAEASNQRFILLLVDMNGSSKTVTAGDPQAAQKLMSALAECVRETDFVGWYHDGAIAGAVLTQWADPTGLDSHDAVGARVERMLAERLPSSIASAIRVRLYQSPTVLPNVS